MIELFAGVAGGLGLFIVGMWLLTENLEALATRRLRRVAGRWTANPFSALVWGALAGAITQRALLQTQRRGEVVRQDGDSPQESALARWSCSNAMASVRAHGPTPKARSTILASPTMPPWRANIEAWPLRNARITSKPLIVA